MQEPPGANLDKTLPVMLDADAGVYYRPQQGGTMVVGSVEPECDDLELGRGQMGSVLMGSLHFLMFFDRGTFGYSR